MIQKLEEATAFLKRRGYDNPDVGVVLGTGLGKLIDKIEVEETINYKSIPHFPVATMEFHSGHLICGRVNGKKIVAMQGRFHFYEGYNMQEITFPIRVMKMLGVKTLLLSNAAGGINLEYKKGDLVVIEDHINLQPVNPLTGPNLEVLGPRFPDMSEPYQKDLIQKLKDIANTQKTPLREGVYVSVTGPNLETRAEYRFLKIIGADMVGMSTVPEVIIANHMNLPCLAVSVITDECDPDNLQPVNIEEIIAVAGKADDKLSNLFVELIGSL
ncbi:MAG: purine-nucleoside phosphorylase [Owenweeksia sp.]